MQSLIIPTQNPLTEGVINGWLNEKFTRTQSVRTVEAYRKYIDEYKEYCEKNNIHDIQGYAAALQAWSSVGENERVLAGASINTRLAAVSSFFDYARRHLIIDYNPGDIVPRKPVQAYRGANTLTPEKVVERITQLDTTTLQGKRDYAILAITLVTGRRLSEVAGLRMSDIENENGSLRVVWRRTKGGKMEADKLPVGVSWRVIDYTEALKQATNGAPPEYLWVALARNQYHMTQMGIKGMELVTKRHLDTTKFHSLRHAFAKAMEHIGADVSEIQRRLGHSSLQTTGIYLAALRSDENKYADSVESLFGIVPNKE